MKNLTTAATFALFASLLTGCVSTPPQIVSEAEGEQFVDAIAMTCHEPYELTQDCGPVVGPVAKLKIDSVEMKIAGSEDGRLIVLRAGSVFDRRGEGANHAYKLVEKLLSENQIQVTNLVPLVSANILKGYVISTNVPAYDILKSYKR